jgi:hypothetical protein
VLVCAALVTACSPVFAAPSYVEVPMNGTRQADTVAGRRYEATLTFDAGTDIGYGMSWIDGDPKNRDSVSFVGIGTGTGTRELKGKESKFLFTVDAKSTAAFLCLVVRSNKPWDITMALADRPSRANRDSQDKWGYYYVTDFDFDRTSPFLLTRGSAK